jgi:hypothetical protein
MITLARRREFHLIVRTTIMLAVTASAVLVTGVAASGAPRHPQTTIRPGARGTGAGHVVDARTLRPGRTHARSPHAAAPQVASPPANPAPPTPRSPGRRPGPGANRPVGAANTASTAAAPARTVSPQSVSSVAASFDGAIGAGCNFCLQPSDVSAAVGASEIVQATNVNIRVYTKDGALLCGFPYADLLQTSDDMTDPRVQYDNVNHRFSTVVTLHPASDTATPAVWVAATQGEDACAGWNTFRVTFNGSLLPPGTLLDFPMLGQDANAVLISTNNSKGGSTAFAIPKSGLYSGAGFSFPVFPIGSTSAPVTNGGIPLTPTANSYFLASVPGTGYQLYTMTDSAGPGTTLVLQATISSPFNAPTRGVNQPGSTTKLDSFDGAIVWSPMLDSSGFIWFAHGMDDSGFPTIRYGAVNVNSNSVTVAEAYHSAASDDFNPSIAIGNSPTGGVSIFLNWAFTDTGNGVSTSDTVNSVAPGGGVPNLVATDTVLVSGASTNQTRFGDYSSVAMDPTVPGGTCAVTAQQYFDAQDWRTRIARVGTC